LEAGGAENLTTTNQTVFNEDMNSQFRNNLFEKPPATRELFEKPPATTCSRTRSPPDTLQQTDLNAHKPYTPTKQTDAQSRLLKSPGRNPPPPSLSATEINDPLMQTAGVDSLTRTNLDYVAPAGNGTRDGLSATVVTNMYLHPPSSEDRLMSTTATQMTVNLHGMQMSREFVAGTRLDGAFASASVSPAGTRLSQVSVNVIGPKDEVVEKVNMQGDVNGGEKTEQNKFGMSPEKLAIIPQQQRERGMSEVTNSNWGVPYVTDGSFSEGPKIGFLLWAIYRIKTLILLDTSPLAKRAVCDIRNI
jgi:hypothetical protein